MNMSETIELAFLKSAFLDTYILQSTYYVCSLVVLHSGLKSFMKLKYFFTKETLVYTVLHIFRQVLFGAGNQGNHQNFEKSLLSYKCWLIFIGMKQKKIFFLKNKIQNGRLKKTEFFNYPQKLSNCRQNFTDWSLG